MSGQAGVHALLTVMVELKPEQGHVPILLPHTVEQNVLEIPQKINSVTQTLAQVIISFCLKHCMNYIGYSTYILRYQILF